MFIIICRDVEGQRMIRIATETCTIPTIVNKQYQIE